MRITLRRLNGALVALLVLVSLHVGGAGSADAVGGAEARLLSGMNDARSANGVPALVADSELGSIARSWSRQMVADYEASGDASGALRHNLALYDRISHSYGRSADNVAYTSKGRTVEERADRILALFLGSAGHRANVLGPYTLTGVGLAEAGDGTLFATVVYTDGAVVSSQSTEPEPEPQPEPQPQPEPGPQPGTRPAPQPSPAPPPPEPEPEPLRMPGTSELFGDGWPEGYLVPGVAPRWEQLLGWAAQTAVTLMVGIGSTVGPDASD